MPPIDPAVLQEQIALLHNVRPQVAPFTPLSSYEKSGNRAAGKKYVESGKVGVIVLAGGLGSRLGLEAPKGLYPIMGKTLFQRLAEKCVAASIAYDSPPRLAIMTSEATHKATVDHFSENNNFGLNDVTF